MAVYSVPGDGNCLFSAVAYGMIFSAQRRKLNKREYRGLARVLRRLTVETLADAVAAGNNDSLLFAMATEVDPDASNLNANAMRRLVRRYLKRMSKNGEWAGEIEIIAIGQIVQRAGFRGIRVHDAQTKRILMQSKMSRTGPIIHLVLHGADMMGTHYDFWHPTLSPLASIKRKV